MNVIIIDITITTFLVKMIKIVVIIILINLTMNLLFLGLSRSTILVRIDTRGKKSLSFHPGDHLAIFPANHPRLVQRLIDALHNAPNPDLPIKIQYCQEKSGK